MFDYRNFDEVFDFNPEYAYNQNAVDAIQAHRKTLEGLFVDKVFKLLDIKRPAKLYPPRTNSDLRTLHQAIVSGASADHAKLSLLYYVLLDCDAMAHRQVYSDAFEDKASLPKRYQIYMKGLWHVDRMEFEISLQYLTHPSLIPTFPDEILETLVQHAKHDNFTLPLAYYHTVQPAITTSHAVERLFSAIAQSSVTEGFYFSRLQADTSRRQMFEMLIKLVLHSPPSETVAARGVELVNLPLNPEEELWLEEYLTVGEGRPLKKAKDTLMMRRITLGKFAQARSLEINNERTIDGLSWELMQNGLEGGLGSRVDIGL